MSAADALTIRPFTAADAEFVARVMRDTPGAPCWAAEEYARLAAPELPASAQGRRRRAWIAASVAPLGFAVASLTQGPGYAEAELEFLAVTEQARRRGVGRQLLQAVVSWARSGQAEALRLEVRASNTPAIQLYEQAGFTRTGLRRGYYRNPSEDAILFAFGFFSE